MDLTPEQRNMIRYEIAEVLTQFLFDVDAVLDVERELERQGIIINLPSKPDVDEVRRGLESILWMFPYLVPVDRFLEIEPENQGEWAYEQICGAWSMF